MPLGEYKDFDECVRKNSDKDDPKAYCGALKAKLEGELPPTEQFRARDFFDTLQEAEFQVEEGTGKLRAKIRIIKAGLSKNNRNYRATAVKEAVNKGMFNGIRMFINHNKDGSPLKRGMKELVSAIETTEWNEQDQAMDGWVEFFDKEFYDYAQRAKDYIGPSINALVRGTRIPQATGRALEDIQAFHEPRSVDWVVYPAAGGAILAFEDEEDEDDMSVDWTKITPEEFQKNVPASVLEQIKAEAKAEAEKNVKPAQEGEEKEGETKVLTQEEIQALVDEGIRKHDEEVQKVRLRQEAAATELRAAFAKSGLPEKTRTRVMASFEGIEEYDEKKVEAAITAAKEELQAVGAGPHITGMGPSGDSSENKGPKPFSVKESVESVFGMHQTPAKTDDSQKES